MTVKNILPEWYPSNIHTSRIPLKDWHDLLKNRHEKAVALDICGAFRVRKPLVGRLDVVQSISRWRTLKVLDWIDLYLWSVESGVVLEAAFLADCFWPLSSVDRRLRLIRSTRPLACSLLSPVVLDTLSGEGSENFLPIYV